MTRLLCIAMMFFAFTVRAQKIKVIEGDLKALKGITAMKLDFTYDNMMVGRKETEKDYVAEKKAALEEKEKGRGAKWEKAWVDDRKEKFEPKFNELFTKHSHLEVSNSAPYTLIFKTTRTEPGWNVGISRAPAYIDGEAWIVDSSNPSNVVAKISVLRALGQDAWGADFETGARLQEAYAKCGKELGGFIRSKTKK